MGLDATVRCRCFEEGKLKPGPVPFEDLYIDDEGYLSSRTLDDARQRLEYGEFLSQYEELYNKFEEWMDNDACEHEFGDYCSERIGNIAGVAAFRSRLEVAGGEAEFPLLSKMLPPANGGPYPAELAQSTLEELDRFIAKVADIDEWVLMDCKTGEKLWTQVDGGAFTWMYGPHQRIGMNGGKVFFWGPGDSYVETAHFLQEPVGEPDTNGSQRMRIVCLDCDAETVAPDSLGPRGAPKERREFHVTSKKAPFLWEGKYWTAESIRNLLVASIETGNPIRWC